MFGRLSSTERLSEVEEGVRTLKAEFKRLELEWIDTLDRLKSMVGRLAKERGRIEEANLKIERGAEPTNGEAHEAPIGSLLSPRARAINNSILGRRSRLRASLPLTPPQEEE